MSINDEEFEALDSFYQRSMRFDSSNCFRRDTTLTRSRKLLRLTTKKLAKCSAGRKIRTPRTRISR